MPDETTTTENSISILVVDDYEPVRTSVRTLLCAEADCNVVAELGDGLEAIEFVFETNLDVVVTDMNLPGADGLSVIREVTAHAPATRVIMLTLHEDRYLAQHVLDSGAAGFLTKRLLDSQLVLAVRAVAHGETYLQPGMELTANANGARRADRQAAALQSATLSATELTLLRLVVAGMTSQQIAGVLRVSAPLAAAWRVRLVEKLGLKNRAQLLQYAKEHRLRDH